MRDDFEIDLAHAAVVIAIIAILAMRDCAMQDRAHAQDAPALTPALVLARVCAKEGGLMPSRGQTIETHAASLRDDCAGIDQVLARGARRSGSSYVAFARRYSPRAFTPGPLNPWVADLRWGAHEPAQWPGDHVPWMPSRARPCGLVQWLALMSLAADIRAGRVESACPVPPDHWGSRLLDHAGREADGWVVEQCGHALNEFWIVPALHRAKEAEHG